MTQARHRMVAEQLAAPGRGITDARVLAAMARVPRHLFVPPGYVDQAYLDQPVPLGHGQTLSQPYIVAFMTEALRTTPMDRVLEVGTGSGYQAAVLSPLVGSVHTVEIVPALATRASALLEELGCGNVHVHAGDGYLGWPDAAPYDAITVTCAPDHVPPPLVEQLREGGRMIIPVGRGTQDLVLLEKHGGGVRTRAVLGVRFVPMTGQAGRTR